MRPLCRLGIGSVGDAAVDLARVPAVLRHRPQGGLEVTPEELAELLRRRVDGIAGEVEALVQSIVGLREELESSGAVMPSMLSYRLAVVLSRVDHAAAEIVLQQARAQEVAGQLRAFDEELDPRPAA